MTTDDSLDYKLNSCALALLLASLLLYKHAHFYRLIMLAQSIQLSCVISHLDALKYKPEALCSISSVIKLYC